MKKTLLLAVISLTGGLSYGQGTTSSPSERIYDAHPFSRPNVFKVGDNSAASTNAPITDQDHHNHASTLHFNEYDKPHSLAPHASGIAHASGGHLWDMERSWWNGSSASANWFGLGFPLKDHGLTVSGEFKQVYYNMAQGGMPNMPKNLWLTEVKLKGIFDFEKIFGDYARGFSFVTNWRYRNRGADPANVEGVPISQLGESSNSGLGMRIMTQYLQWQSDGSKDPSLVVHAGWGTPTNTSFSSRSLNSSNSTLSMLPRGSAQRWAMASRSPTKPARRNTVTERQAFHGPAATPPGVGR